MCSSQFWAESYAWNFVPYQWDLENLAGFIWFWLEGMGNRWIHVLSPGSRRMVSSQYGENYIEQCKMIRQKNCEKMLLRKQFDFFLHLPFSSLPEFNCFWPSSESLWMDVLSISKWSIIDSANFTVANSPVVWSKRIMFCGACEFFAVKVITTSSSKS